MGPYEVHIKRLISGTFGKEDAVFEDICRIEGIATRQEAEEIEEIVGDWDDKKYPNATLDTIGRKGWAAEKARNPAAVF